MMTPERIAELEAIPRPSFTNEMRREMLTEIKRCHALMANRPDHHIITLHEDYWSAAHPLTCVDPGACTVVTADIASDLRDAYERDGNAEYPLAVHECPNENWVSEPFGADT